MKNINLPASIISDENEITEETSILLSKEEKTKAIIFIDIKTKDEGNGKAGSGKTYLLENKDNQWKIINIICVYNSFKLGSMRKER